MCQPNKFQALAATARLANLPSVAGNVWLGIALGAAADGWATHDHPWQRALTLGAAGACLYLAGNFLNDWADRDWDARHRPERALPRALFPARFYLWLAFGCAALGLAAAASVHRGCLGVALLIALSILLYTWSHKRTLWAVIPMGGCRALLPVLGFAGWAAPGVSFATPLPGHSVEWSGAVAACAAGLFCHIAGLSLSARYESQAQPQPPTAALRAARSLFAAAALAMGLANTLLLALPLLPGLLALLPYGLWMALCLSVFRHPLARQVGNLLAGIPLVDWIVLLPLGGLAIGTCGPLAAMCLGFPPLAVLAGLLLQKFAPAT